MDAFDGTAIEKRVRARGHRLYTRTIQLDGTDRTVVAGLSLEPPTDPPRKSTRVRVRATLAGGAHAANGQVKLCAIYGEDVLVAMTDAASLAEFFVENRGAYTVIGALRVE